ncbi:MAG: glycosyltransferase family 2 protein [Caulobacter sp.]|nr:glycosyltransferase family 2 protein [Caulobacter sp.]
MTPSVYVVLPCYRTLGLTVEVIAGIGPEVAGIVVVDDGCPDGTGDHVSAAVTDPRVVVLRHAANQGVGAATLTGFAHAFARGADIAVKLDGDGQMHPGDIARLVRPIALGQADVAKGNRFFNPAWLERMPADRRLANLLLSFSSKPSSGYWAMFDASNGFFAIHRAVFAMLPVERLARGYYFETDLWFRLGLVRAVIVDVPIAPRYSEAAAATSQVRLWRLAPVFVGNVLRNGFKRLFYRYLLQDFSAGSLYLALAVVLTGFGGVFGLATWIHNAVQGVVTTPGTVMLAALPVFLGLQFLFAFLAFDISAQPTRPLHPDLGPGPGDFGA